MNAPDGMKEAWQGLSAERQAPPLDEVRRSARAFDRQIRIRNAIEYGAGAVVILFFSYAVFQTPNPVLRFADLLIVLGACFVMWQLWRRGSVPEMPASGATSDLARHYRAHLIRQRDALNSIWLWYLLPFAPGMILSLFAVPIVSGKEWAKAASIFVVVIVFVGGWWLNWRGAKRLQKTIDELDAVGGIE